MIAFAAYVIAVVHLSEVAALHHLAVHGLHQVAAGFHEVGQLRGWQAEVFHAVGQAEVGPAAEAEAAEQILQWGGGQCGLVVAHEEGKVAKLAQADALVQRVLQVVAAKLHHVDFGREHAHGHIFNHHLAGGGVLGHRALYPRREAVLAPGHVREGQEGMVLDGYLTDGEDAFALLAAVHRRAPRLHHPVGLLGGGTAAIIDVDVAAHAVRWGGVERGQRQSLEHDGAQGRLGLGAGGEPCQRAQVLLVGGLDNLHLAHPVHEQVSGRQQVFGQLAHGIVDDALHGLFPGHEVQLVPFGLAEGEPIGGGLMLP